MIQAAPLVLSFARAVPMLNKLVGAVGITELGNRVNNYIQENPDESAKIVSMIMPTQGIANALKNKSNEDVEEVEETEEVTTGSGVEERIREILREAGVEDADNQDLTDLPKDLEAKVMSGIAKSSTDRKKDMIEASAIIGLSGPGRERKKMIDDVSERYDEGGVEDAPKPKFDFTKFYKNRRRRADGGSIGIEVLFEPKREKFNIGGTPYDARATTQDFTNALDKVGAGTDLQKAVAIGEYGQNARRQNPFKNLGFLDTQRHFDNNQLLKNAVTRGELSPADYNRLGGFDVAQTMGAGNPVLGGIGNLIGSTGYNIVQSLKGNQSPFDIPGDVFRNVQGGTGLISNDLKAQYENIINQKAATPTPNASTDRPTMADVAGPGTSNNLLSLFERYKDIQTPAGADPNNPDFVGETALGNIEKGVKGFLTSDIGLKYGKDIPSDINDIYSSIEAQRRAFSPDLSQNYQGGDLYYYLQNFYKDKYGLKEGGRVGLFMGGPPLTGQALQTYNSMKAYGFSDQEIADALSLQRASASNAETATAATAAPINIYNQLGGGGNGPDDDDDDDDGPTSNAGLKGFDAVRSAGLFALNPVGFLAAKAVKGLYDNYKNPYKNIMGGLNKGTRDAIDAQGRDSAPGRDDAGNPGGSSGSDTGAPGYCFDPKTLIQMADGSTKEIKNIQLGDQTKGGEVTGVFQFKASDEIYDYKGVTVAGSHFVKEDDKFIMVKDSPLSVKIDKIPVVYSLDTTGRRIFIKDIEFADYNGDGVAKSFLTNAGVDLTGFDTEVLRQVENRLI